MDKGLPVSTERAVFLSDAHLNQEDLHTRSFLLLAEKALREGASLFMLGDVFDLWFGAPGLTFPFQRPVIDRLRELRREGLRLYYVEGNRDFYLKKHYEGTLFDAVAEDEMLATVGARTVSLSHGDTVNRADRAYRFWKAISKNPLSYRTFASLPSGLTLPLSERLERRLKRTNKRYRGWFPEDACRTFAFRKFESGVDIVVMGHFHTERLLRFRQDAATRVLAVLPSWKDGWRYLFLTAAGDFGFRAFSPDAGLLP